MVFYENLIKSVDDVYKVLFLFIDTISVLILCRFHEGFNCLNVCEFSFQTFDIELKYVLSIFSL